MTQPTFADGPPVPLLLEGVLNRDQLSQLFADLTAHATGLEVREKHGEQAHSHSARSPLAAVLDRLQNGTGRALQLRYRFDSFDWTDTILAVPSGFRVVRTRHEVPQPT